MWAAHLSLVNYISFKIPAANFDYREMEKNSETKVLRSLNLTSEYTNN